jgi:hypothetical protein
MLMFLLQIYLQLFKILVIIQLTTLPGAEGGLGV